VHGWVLGDLLWTGKAQNQAPRPIYSLSLPSVTGWNETMSIRRKLGCKQVHRVIHHPVSVRGFAVWCWCLDEWAGLAWLAEISADLREAVAHLRRVRDDALYQSTVTLLYYFTCFIVSCQLRPSGVINMVPPDRGKLVKLIAGSRQ